jgi:hypothetical protein
LQVNEVYQLAKRLEGTSHQYHKTSPRHKPPVSKSFSKPLLPGLRDGPRNALLAPSGTGQQFTKRLEAVPEPFGELRANPSLFSG